ncbi:hypothetical protein ABG768_012514 [Culter alburnus]|uniref:Chemokine interleukin-8-like domain-containing protein n=1 Tax=Culter alburnus TaxID=194366 RepID=A0AAW2B135_CULAL
MMKSLAAIAVIMSVMIMETNGESPIECCRTVSTKKITVPITGFRFQTQNLPCVTAVIFNTTEGPMCSHGGLKWVREKVKQLMKLQRQQKMNSTVILSP